MGDEVAGWSEGEDKGGWGIVIKAIVPEMENRHISYSQMTGGSDIMASGVKGGLIER